MSRERRRYEPNWPNYSNKRMRQGRAVVALLVLIAIGVSASLFAPKSENNSAAPSTANATRTADLGPPETGPLILVQRDGAWVASGTLARRGDATRVTVEHIVDGDTIDVRAAQTPLRIRFYGVDTPERGEACYSEATARTAALAANSVILVPDTRLQDSGGRELRYVFTPEGHSLDATLVVEGLAKAWRADGTLRDELVALEDDARRARRGCLWSG